MHIRKTSTCTEVPLVEQKKIDERNEARAKKRLIKATAIINENKQLLIDLMEAVYHFLPVNQPQLKNTAPFIDHLYFLNLAVINIMTKGNIKKFDPYLRETLMELIFTDQEITRAVSKQIDTSLKHYLIALRDAFIQQMDSLSERPAIAHLIAVHSTEAHDACDHMMQTCNDRANLLDDFLKFSVCEKYISTAEEKTMIAHGSIVESYLKDFYSATTLKKFLPDHPKTDEEKILIRLIDAYAKIVNSADSFSQKYFSFFATQQTQPALHTSELLSSMRITIRAYQEKYNAMPSYMEEILWRLNGLIPAQKVAQPRP